MGKSCGSFSGAAESEKNSYFGRRGGGGGRTQALLVSLCLGWGCLRAPSQAGRCWVKYSAGLLSLEAVALEKGTPWLCEAQVLVLSGTLWDSSSTAFLEMALTEKEKGEETHRHTHTDTQTHTHTHTDTHHSK